MKANPITSNNTTRKHRHEGKQKHIIAFIFSIMLTLIAFAAAGSAGEINSTFTIILLLIMAILQVIMQMVFWMHMKDKGHIIPIVCIISGSVVAFTAILTSIYWIWW